MNEHDEVANIVADKMEEFIRNKFAVNKLTDAEIVERLCSCDSYFDCDGCPYEAVCNGLGDLTDKTLDLIKRKDKRIEELTAENNRQKAEIEELWADNNYLFETMPHMKTEAIKEFAEKLKCRSHRFKTIDRIFVDCIPLDYIDNLVKEMVGDNDV